MARASCLNDPRQPLRLGLPGLHRRFVSRPFSILSFHIGRPSLRDMLVDAIQGLLGRQCRGIDHIGLLGIICPNVIEPCRQPFRWMLAKIAAFADALNDDVQVRVECDVVDGAHRQQLGQHLIDIFPRV